MAIVSDFDPEYGEKMALSDIDPELGWTVGDLTFLCELTDEQKLRLTLLKEVSDAQDVLLQDVRLQSAHCQSQCDEVNTHRHRLAKHKNVLAQQLWEAQNPGQDYMSFEKAEMQLSLLSRQHSEIPLDVSFEAAQEALQLNIKDLTEEVCATFNEIARRKANLRSGKKKAVELLAEITKSSLGLRELKLVPKTPEDEDEEGAVQWVQTLALGEVAAELARFEKDQNMERITHSLWV